jgi:hypothetical protein
MRNDFLTPRGTPYKWQELTASLERTVTGGDVPTITPVRYEWQRVESRVGTPRDASQPREWTFARGQGFDSVLLHAELAGSVARAVPPVTVPAAEQGRPSGGRRTPSATMTIGYPSLPKSPAVDLLLMLSWDVVTFEMLCTHLTGTPELREVGGRAVLDRLSGTWAELQFSGPDEVGVFRNTVHTAQHLGSGCVAGRPSVIYTSYCLDCELDVRSGPVSQRGRSSYWVTLQADAETADLLAADMTEMIVATLTGQDGRRVPVFKRRIVRMWVPALDGTGLNGTALSGTALNGTALSGTALNGTARTACSAGLADLEMAEAIRLAGQVADFLARHASSLESLPRGMSELAIMGFRSIVGTDAFGAFRLVKSLQAGLTAAARPHEQSGSTDADSLWEALPGHRRRLEGVLAFVHMANDRADQGLLGDEAQRRSTRADLAATSADLTELLALIDQLERPADPAAPPSQRL